MKKNSLGMSVGDIATTKYIQRQLHEEAVADQLS